MKYIQLNGVKQNNLKNIDVQIPIGSFTTICGPSGSGKSSLAFETLYAEGQRRYLESLSNYSKQFLSKAPKPNVESITNIPPAISIEQKNGVKSSRSTVGTSTEVIDYLRLLYEKIGVVHCPNHETPLEKNSPPHGAKKVLSLFAKQRGYILAPIYLDNQRVTGKQLLNQLMHDGFLRILIPHQEKELTRSKKTKGEGASSKVKKSQGGGVSGKVKKTQSNSSKTISSKTISSETISYFKEDKGEVLDLDIFVKSKKRLPHSDFYIVVDRLAFNDESRLIDSISQAYSATMKYNKDCTDGRAKVLTTDGLAIYLDERLSCSICGHHSPEIDSRLFSFNNPLGACKTCSGFGNTLNIDPKKVIPNPQLSIYSGAIRPLSMPSQKRVQAALINYCNTEGIDIHIPWKDLDQKSQASIWKGNKKLLGIVGFFQKLEKKKYQMHIRILLARYKSPFTCKSCNGTRLKKQSQSILIGDKSITDLTRMNIDSLHIFLSKLKLSEEQNTICKEAFRQMFSRLHFLNQVGLGYLTLDRPTSTLSGGEYQRIVLSNQLGMELSQALYVLDEPTIGLHPRDNERLIQILHALKDLGNTLVVVEHDHDVIKSSSHIIEMGPGSGHLGGNIIFNGTKNDFYKAENSNTVEYLNPKKSIRTPYEPKPTNIKNDLYTLNLTGCKGNNLKNIDFYLPLHRFVTITGVSGSGKSSLVSQTLYPALAEKLNVAYLKCLPYEALRGGNTLNNVLFIDQSPIGASARSMPVTYLKAFDHIRTIMAQSSEARRRGYTPGTFSINVDGGRCPVCKGLGVEVIDMMFMDDIHLLCESCNGLKYRSEVLEVTYKNKNISDILNMTVSEAMNFFVSYPNIRKPLSILKEVGLDYLNLGQSASTLSGGESQRLKIAREFSLTQQNGSLYILDEPTTGLHFQEVHLLIKALNRLITGGASVLVIEHNLEIIRNSDYIIDIGPEAGEKGGRIVTQGPPEKIIRSIKSHTGKYLKDYMGNLLPNPNAKPII